MVAERLAARVLIGPRSLDDRICRLMYVQETDEAWTEVWSDRAWVRVPILVRYVLKAPVPAPAVLKRFGVKTEPGEWDREQACA